MTSRAPASSACTTTSATKPTGTATTVRSAPVTAAARSGASSSTAPASSAAAACSAIVVEPAHRHPGAPQREADRPADEAGPDERDGSGRGHDAPSVGVGGEVGPGEIGAQRGRALEEHVLELVARALGVAVHQHPDAERRAVGDVLLLGAEQRDLVEPERGACRAGGELGGEVGGAR